MNTYSFIQWNCRSLLQNIDDIHFFLDELKPIAVCLQEAYVNNTHTNVFNRHRIFRKDRDSDHSSGGVAIVVRSGIACVEVPLVHH